MVYPFAMHFKQAQCFCQSVSGGHHGEGAHLMSIHSLVDYAALEVAANKAGVTGAIFVGGHETAEGAWRWTDGTWLPSDQSILVRPALSQRFRFSEVVCLNHGRCLLAQDAHGYFDNYGQNEVRFWTEILDDFRRFVDEIWRF